MNHDHTRFVVGCITTLAIIAALCGAWLLWKGFAGGAEMIVTLNTAIAGMIGFLANQKKPQEEKPDVKPPIDTPVQPDRTGA